MPRRFAILLGAATIAACAAHDLITPPSEPTPTKIEFTIVPNDWIRVAVGDTAVTGVRVSTSKGPAVDPNITFRISDTTVAVIAAWRESHLFLRALRPGVATLTAASGAATATIGVVVWGPPSDYEMIELGTLGGDVSYPLALNDSGQVVGYSTTASGEQHAFLWSNGVMRDVGASVPGASQASTITNSARIGISNIYDGPNSHVFVWKDGTTTDLGQTRGGDAYSSMIIGMTANDVVARADGQEHPFSSIWHGSAKQDLGGLYPPLGSSFAYAMNARGQIVGGSTVAAYVGSDIHHPFVWQNGMMRELALLGSSPCPSEPKRDCSAGEAVDINSNGAIVGWSGGVELTPRGVLWQEGKPPVELGFRRPVAINDFGDVAGNSSLSGLYWQDDGEGYYWHQGTRTALGSLGCGGTEVTDMNDQSVVIGSSLTRDSLRHAFVWKPGLASVIDLTKYGEGSGAVAINTRGDIIGWFTSCSESGEGGSCREYSRNKRAVLWRKR